MVEGSAPVSSSARINEHGKKMVKVVFTGGPCAGKSTCIQEIKRRIEENYAEKWQVFTAAEVASVLYFGGISRDHLSQIQLLQWQSDVLQTIFRVEDVYENIHNNESSRNTIVLCDRGGMDPRVFTPDSMWTDILKTKKLEEEDILRRYDMVIQLHTAPPHSYERESNRFRRETYNTAAEIDSHYGEVWANHPSLIPIELNESMSGKVGQAWENVKQLL